MMLFGRVSHMSNPNRKGRLVREGVSKGDN